MTEHTPHTADYLARMDKARQDVSQLQETGDVDAFLDSDTKPNVVTVELPDNWEGTEAQTMGLVVATMANELEQAASDYYRRLTAATAAMEAALAAWPTTMFAGDSLARERLRDAWVAAMADLPNPSA